MPGNQIRESNIISIPSLIMRMDLSLASSFKQSMNNGLPSLHTTLPEVTTAHNAITSTATSCKDQ